MCRGQGQDQIFNENSNQIEVIEEIPWPLNINETGHFYGCITCAYPIIRQDDVLEIHISNVVGSNIASSRTRAVVVDLFKLYTEDFVPTEEEREPWEIKILCFACGILLSFNEENVSNNIKQIRSNINVGILNQKLLRSGTALELKTLFEE